MGEAKRAAEEDEQGGQVIDFGERLRARKAEVQQAAEVADGGAELYEECDSKSQDVEKMLLKLMAIRDAKMSLSETYEGDTPEETARIRAELRASVAVLEEKIQKALAIRLAFVEMRDRMGKGMTGAMRQEQKMRGGPRRGIGSNRVLEFRGKGAEEGSAVNG